MFKEPNHRNNSNNDNDNDDGDDDDDDKLYNNEETVRKPHNKIFAVE